MASTIAVRHEPTLHDFILCDDRDPWEPWAGSMDLDLHAASAPDGPERGRCHGPLRGRGTEQVFEE